MQEGLLWFDNNPNRKVADKVEQAAKRYQDKLNCRPTVCYLNIAEFDEAHPEVDGIRLKPLKNVLPHHFFIGVE